MLPQLKNLIIALGCLPLAPACAPEPLSAPPRSNPFVVVLGVAQDGGVPQAGTREHRGWREEGRRRHVVCLGLVDPRSGKRWMFEATPDFRHQLHVLDEIAPAEEAPGLDGVFLTHAHMGHYTGLMFLGFESIGGTGPRSTRVHALPRMAAYLRSNGPWDQLVRYGNVVLDELVDGAAVELTSDLSVTAFRVPHRQEYSEVAGFRIDGPQHSVLFIPDINSWQEWDSWGQRIEDVLATVDVAYLDGCFYDQGEVPGRDMSAFPHPLMRNTLQRLASLPADERAKVRFVHLNHTNPALWPESPERKEVEEAGFHVARELEEVDL